MPNVGLSIMTDDDVENSPRREILLLQSMIDISAANLDGLRTQCATSAELTQQEIRTLEGKLIKLYSRQLVAKKKILTDRGDPSDVYPQLHQWLHVVGLSKSSIYVLTSKVLSVEALLEKTDHEIRWTLQDNGAQNEEVRRLVSALQNLKKYTEIILKGDKTNCSDFELHWDSWDQNPNPVASSPRPPRSINSSSSTSSSTIRSDEQGPEPTTPRSTPTVAKKNEKGKFPSTPPPRKKHLTNLLPEPLPLHKSRSHESQLSNRIEQTDNTFVGYDNTTPQRGRHRLATEPGPELDSLLGTSPVLSPPYDSDDTKQSIPKSPRTPPITGSMGHYIQHRFVKSVKVFPCDYCTRSVFFGVKCKECKYKCHRDCMEKVPPSCGLPVEYLDIFAKSISTGDGSRSPVLPLRNATLSPNAGGYGGQTKERKKSRMHPPFQHPDSSSNTSSCNSSTPSSPLIVPPVAAPNRFDFSNLDKISFETLRHHSEMKELAETQKSNDSDRTVSGTSGSTDSEKTVAGRVDSQDSQISDVDANERNWPRQNSLSLREWDIPYDDLTFQDSIGSGMFGTVFRGHWHGDVAIKVLYTDPTDDEKSIEAFKQEVTTFRKTRHENLVLFMGACMKPPRLAIVTSLCKGQTLFVHLHVHKERFNINRTVLIAQQITQGMGYLHARGIVHKNLKSKNIFLEKDKVIITDFGLFSITKLCCNARRPEYCLTIPPGWLCYLAPEIIRSLRSTQNDNLPFTMASDIYAFGTVWFELLCGEWPFKGQPTESIIWQVGRGIKQSLASVQAARDVKELLMQCWAFKPAERPPFAHLLKMLEKLPKKRLARSPSHPIQLSRSAESVF